MREIKFRAWDKELKHFTMQDPTISPILPDKTWQLETHQDIILMQYTGLKDKNGKEIYEHDIIQTDTGNRGVVNHSNSICWYMEYNLRDNPNMDKKHRYDTENKVVQLWKISQENRCEVIGNIYENPGLLKSEE